MNTTTMPRFSEMSHALEIIPLNQLPLLKEGDDLAGIIVSRARRLGVGIRNRDLVVIGQKAVSKAEGRIIDTRDVIPSARATKIAKKTGKTAELTGKHVAVVVCDTRSRPFRKGQVEESIGVAGLNPLVDYRGQKDLFGYTLRFKNVAIVDELASAAELVMGQGRERTPVAIIRGLTRVRLQKHASSRFLFRFSNIWECGLSSSA